MIQYPANFSTQQIPSLREKFPTYEEFGGANLVDIYGPKLEAALNLEAKTFASAYIENLGNGAFAFKPLPSLAQTSSVNNILIKDYDEDGHKDLLISGNLYQSEIETPRNDAGTGLFLKGNGKGEFKVLKSTETGLFIKGDVKDMEPINVNNQKHILVAKNNDYVQYVRLNK